MHGPIGFQPFWLRKQGYAGRNLLQLIADQSFKRRIDVTAITSQADEIPKGSVHDRFGCLVQEATLLPRGYTADLLGQNILVVESGDQRVYVVNGQTAMPREDGKKYDLLVVGSNGVPNGLRVGDTLEYCKDRGLFRGAEHPLIESHRGLGEELLGRHIDEFDAIEGFNAQAVFPVALTKLPVVGRGFFSRAGRELNEKAKQVAREYGKPYIATSDAHRIEDLGVSHIEWTGTLEDSSEEGFLTGLREIIRSGDFRTIERYVGVVGWGRWVATFQLGVRDPEHNKGPYVLSDQFR